ncbi:MAG: ATP-binding protein [Bacteroidota bacterium]|nr:ATP-binding protein [Bacteroidota bacterium]
MIIIISGLPGSGKSFFAEKLAYKLDAVHINSDKVRKAKDAMGKYALQDKFYIYHEMVKLAEKSLQEQKTVILDATFYLQSIRDMILELAQYYSSKICFIYVYANEEAIKQRLSKKRIDSEADFKVYKLIKDQFEEITQLHLKLESKNDNIDYMLNEAEMFIKSCYEGSGNL